MLSFWCTSCYNFSFIFYHQYIFTSSFKNEMMISDTHNHKIFLIWYQFKEYCSSIKCLLSIYDSLPTFLLEILIFSDGQVMNFPS